MNIYVISDTHFGHSNILKFTGANGLIRPGFADVNHMNQYMIDKWNSVVTPQDHVYHLGDVALSSHYLAIVEKLNGHKRLILGNHDREDMGKYRKAGFQKIYGSRLLDGVLMTHFPVHLNHFGKAVVNAHGHIHQHESPPGPYVNVSVERWDYTPQLLEFIKQEGLKRCPTPTT